MGMSPYVRALRSAIGSTRILMPSVSGIARDGNGGILLVKQRDDGIWSTAGGSVDPGETPANAVVRELWEETGLLVRPTRLIAVYGGSDFVVRYPNGDETQYISTIFECAVVSGTLRADGEETTEARFWTHAEAVRLPLAPWLAKVLPRLFDGASEAWFEPPTWRQPGDGVR